MRDPPPPDEALNRARVRELRAAVGRPLGWTPGRARLAGRQREGEVVVCERGWYFTGQGHALAVPWSAVRGARPVGRVRARVEVAWDGGTLRIWFPDRRGAGEVLEAVTARTSG
jgi:hypothetical protein